MARARIDEDYASKKHFILDTAAKLFARDGYANAKMADIAKKCGASKSMLYHYFPKKDDILFELLKEHLEDLIALFTGINNDSVEAGGRFAAFVEGYICKSREVRTRHVVAMYDLRFLPKSRQGVIVELERRLLGVVCDMLTSVNPNLKEYAYKPYALLVFGMLNWTDIWYRPDGVIPREEMCNRISHLFLEGFLQEKI